MRDIERKKLYFLDTFFLSKSQVHIVWENVNFIEIHTIEYLTIMVNEN